MNTTDRWLGWHFLTDDRRLQNGDNRIVVAGETYTTPDLKRQPELCVYGMHASKWALDALKYARGSHVSRVELIGERIDGDDKSCARMRPVLWIADATDVLRTFARDEALRVAHLWNADEKSLEYLRTGDEALRAHCQASALACALASARYDVLASARYAAEASARDRDSALYSARYVARDAAEASARASARESALYSNWASVGALACVRSEQNARLEAALMALAPEGSEK